MFSSRFLSSNLSFATASSFLAASLCNISILVRPCVSKEVTCQGKSDSSRSRYHIFVQHIKKHTGFPHVYIWPQLFPLPSYFFNTTLLIFVRSVSVIASNIILIANMMKAWRNPSISKLMSRVWKSNSSSYQCKRLAAFREILSNVHSFLDWLFFLTDWLDSQYAWTIITTLATQNFNHRF